MPSTMIHLLTAFAYNPDSDDLFWVGSFAPDYTDERALKDKIHLRDVPDRWQALDALRETINLENPFEAGWLLHLFADTVWDETMIPRYARWFTSTHKEGVWFSRYRREIAFAGFFMYHSTPWASRIWERISQADLSGVATSLPITREENKRYRDRKVLKHMESSTGARPEFFTKRMLEEYVESTVLRYREWMR